MSRLGRVLSEGDCGAYVDTTRNLVHIYTEDRDAAEGVGSRRLSHWTTPTDSLLSATQRTDAVDVTDRRWKTADPDVIRYSDTYYLFADRTREEFGGHPRHSIALW